VVAKKTAAQEGQPIEQIVLTGARSSSFSWVGDRTRVGEATRSKGGSQLFGHHALSGQPSATRSASSPRSGDYRPFGLPAWATPAA
jgi:hypothetical protein